MPRKGSTNFYTIQWLRSRAVANEDGCLVWQNKLTHKGYGQINLNQTGTKYAHRAMYILVYGMIPGGLVVHHKCHNTACINPEHLELLTSTANLLLEPNPFSSRTHCKRGHPLPPYTGSVRRCRECIRLVDREDYRKKMSERPPLLFDLEKLFESKTEGDN
jgi:hypothetical protein